MPETPAAPPRMSQKVAVSGVFVAAMFMSIMDATIINVAVPTLGRDFHTNPAAVDSVIIGYLVSLAVFIPASGWLGDKLGGKRVLLAAIAIFTIASALCGAATSLPELVIFRVLQGVGGGLMTPVGMAMLYRVFPPAERVRASSILILPTAVAPALGPVLGGLFVTDLTWRWVFYVNVPFGIAALVFGALFLVDTRQPEPGRFDLPGFILAGAGLGSLMYGVSEGPSHGWSSPAVITAIVVGAVLLTLLLIVELRVAAPMLDLRLYQDGLFRTTSVTLMLGSTGFMGVLYLVALFFQDGLGLTALQSGLNTGPEAIGVMIGSQLITRQLYPVLGPRRIILGSLLAVTAMMLLLSRVGTDTSLWTIRGEMLLLGFSMSGVFIPSQAAAFATIPQAKTGRASTLFNAQRQLGGAIGVAMLTTIITAIGPSHLVDGHREPHLLAYQVGFMVAAGLALLAAFAAFGISDKDAAETIVGRRRKPAAPQVAEPDLVS
jgi:EmrB/QacA subfamily drug resistance transporter